MTKKSDYDRVQSPTFLVCAPPACSAPTEHAAPAMLTSLKEMLQIYEAFCGEDECDLEETICRAPICKAIGACAVARAARARAEIAKAEGRS